MMGKVKAWMQQETLLVITFILAVVSAFVVPPHVGYLEYIDWDTLALLLGLMTVMAGFKSIGVFDKMSEMLLSKMKSQRAIEIVLVCLCFFSSMIITNDVALITFVPFAIGTLHLAGLRNRILPVVVLQTIAANLGSMVTPIGNPQNIYLYFQSGFSMAEFFGITIPFALASFVLLMVCICAKKDKPVTMEGKKSDSLDTMNSKENKLKLLFFGMMFFLCLFSLTRIVSVCVIAVIVVVCTLFVDRKIMAKVDYSLLLTFINFFIFVGNMQQIPMLSDAIRTMVSGNELFAAIGISQVISNVPAVLLLTGFTQSWKLLIIGSNLGGLGTLIASMASLISYKYVAKECPNEKMKYLIQFTVMNVIFLAVNLLVLFVV